MTITEGTGIYHRDPLDPSVYHQLTPIQAWEQYGHIMRGFHPPVVDSHGNIKHPATYNGKPVASTPAVDEGASLDGESGWQNPK